MSILNVALRSALAGLFSRRLAVLVAVFAACVIAMPAGAQDAPQPPADTQSNTEENEPPAPPRPRRPSGDEDVFIPSEEIAADEEITFPVDI